MDKKFWISGFVMTFLSLFLGFLVHGALLAGDYAALGSLFRTPADLQNYLPFMMLAHLLQSLPILGCIVRASPRGKAQSPKASASASP